MKTTTPEPWSGPEGDRPEAAARILRAARQRLFAHGFSGLNLDELAVDLGMSKRTFYRHFPNKTALARAAIESFAAEIRRQADDILDDAARPFPAKLSNLLSMMAAHLSVIQPHALRDLQRLAPELHELIQGLRQKNLPAIFGRLLAEGQRRARVRRDVDPSFAAAFLLHAMQGLMNPGSFGESGQSPGDVFAAAMRLFFGGLLTTTGRREYERATAV